MNPDMKKRRRQVAWICFEPHLPEEQLIKAIQILEHGFQVDSVSNLIAYITRICSEFGLDTGVRKSLYGQFHELMAQDTQLLIDPLPLIQEQEKEQLRASQKPPAVPTLTPVAPASAETVAVSGPTAVEAQTVAGNIPVHVWIFSYFMQQMVNYLPNPDDFFEALTELASNKKLSTQEIEMQINSWLTDTDNYAWAESLSEKNLSEIVHLVYTALCEALGPIAADDSFHKALAKCEQTPQAKHFSPSRFL